MKSRLNAADRSTNMKIELKEITVKELTEGYIDNAEAGVIVSPTTPSQPESGELRAIFYQKNQPFGIYSPNYPLTIS
jgi:hypothetical protein